MRRWRSAAARRLCQFTSKTSVEEAVVEVGRRLTDGQTAPPIRLEAIFPRVRVSICRSDPNLTVSGELRRAEPNTFEIVYSSGQPVTRQRFTIAHELAHVVFEHTGAHCPRRGRELERLCDRIASEILTPRQLFREWRARSEINLDEIKRLAGEFHISTTSAAIRCSELFGTLVCQFDNEDMTWMNGGHELRMRSLRKQLSREACISLERGSPDREIQLFKDDGGPVRIRLEFTDNGDDRQLFVASLLPAQLPTRTASLQAAR